MNRTAVESTTLATVAYDDDLELLQLEFRSRAIYQYCGAPRAVHGTRRQAPSQGRSFNRALRGHYTLVCDAQTGVLDTVRRSER